MAKMSTLTRRRYRRLLRHLRKDAPPNFPVVIRWMTKHADGGDCLLEKRRRRFVIRLDRRMACRRCDLIDTLIHEWAHCLAWIESASVPDHSDIWGVAFARCYRIWESLRYDEDGNERSDY